jgi:hypothetical protein
MNAIYMNKDGKLEDYVGGIDDILNGKIRFNGDPLERITGNFCRIFRYFRFITVYGGYDYNQEYISIINTFIKNKCYTKAGRKPYILKEMLKTFRKSDSHRAIPEMRFLLEKIFDLDLNHNPLEICFQLGFSDMSPIERVCMLFKFSKIPMKDFVKEYNISAFSEPMAKLLLLADAIDIEDAKNNLGNIPKECRNFHIKYTLLKMYIAGTPESKIKKLAAEIKL